MVATGQEGDGMKAEARRSMFERLEKLAKYEPVNMSDCMAFAVREVDRALHEQRYEQHVCLDCRTVLIPQPTLCDGCVRTRLIGGIDPDSMRRHP